MRRIALRLSTGLSSLFQDASRTHDVSFFGKATTAIVECRLQPDAHFGD
jgi:hypothetical protein